MEKKKNQIQ